MSRRARTLLALALSLLTALGAAVPAHADRLDDAAAGLRESPLYVDPELGWILDARQRRDLTRTLRDADVPVLVAVLPHLESDESGGDGERMVRGLQDRLRRDAVYIVSDERGALELASMGVPRDLRIPYSLTYAELSAERPADGGPLAGAVGRLGQIVARVNAAGPGPPNGPTEPTQPLRPVNAPLSSGGRGLEVGDDIVAPLIVGAALGLTLLGLAVAAVAGVQAARGGRDA